MSAIEELLSIKVFRERSAELAVIHQHRVFDAAVRARDAASSDFKEFCSYALHHERLLYATLCAGVFRAKDIESVQTKLDVLRQQERLRKDVLEQSEKECVEAARVLSNAQVFRSKASKEKQKFEDLARARSNELLKDSELHESSETDEFTAFYYNRVGLNDCFDEEGRL